MNGFNDFFISNHCNKNNKSSSTFGHIFELPIGLNYISTASNSYLAGKQNFLVKEIEIYSLDMD